MSRLVTFRAGGSAYAVPADLVHEVVELARVRMMPFARNPDVLGLARVRDRFIPVLQVGESAEAAGHADEETALLVLGEGGARLGIRIEEVGDVVHAEVDRRSHDADTGAVIRVGDELIRYVDPGALVGGRQEVLRGSDRGGSKVDGTVNEKLSLVAFRIGPEDFALDVMKVHEVLRVPEVRRVPRAPEFVEGMAEVRDAVVPVIDLRRRFGAESPSHGSENRLLVVSLEDGQVGLIVDSVPGVVEYPADALSPAPRLVRGLEARYLEGVVRDEEADRLLMLLDVDEVLHSKEKIALKSLMKDGPNGTETGAGDDGNSKTKRGRKRAKKKSEDDA